MSKLMRPARQSAGVVQIPDAPVMAKRKDAAAPSPQEAQRQAVQEAELQQIYANVIQRAKEDGERFAQTIVAHARKDREQMLAEAQREGQTLKEAARAEGYAAGTEEKAKEIEETLRRVESSIRQMQKDQEQFFEALSSSVQEFALDIAGHLMARTLEKDEQVLKDLADAALEDVKDTAWVTLEVSEQLPGLVALLEKEYAKSRPGRARIEVRARELPADAVILNTPDGVIDATLSRQLENLREGFGRLKLQADPRG
ncbi:MAG: FliH/SctL family protein [Oscillospiraceae bacterium]|nr:FliH/SctL family protein [Oscillospiraceae bacterium]